MIEPPSPNPDPARDRAAGDDLRQRLQALERAEREARQLVDQLRAEIEARDVALDSSREQLEIARLKLEQTESALSNLSTLFAAAAVPIVIADPDGNITDLNPEAERKFDTSRRVLLGRPLTDLVPEQRRDRVADLLQRCRAGQKVRNVEFELWDKSADLQATCTTLSPLVDADGQVVGVALAEDMRELKESTLLLTEINRRLQSLLLADALTEVGNRRLFERDLEREVGRAARDAELLSVAMIDVDHFKSFNDEFGHLAGDACLRTVGRTIAGCLHRAGDSVARFGGEEFAVLLPKTEPAGARQLAERIRRQVARAHEMQPALQRPVTVSIGVATAAMRPEITSTVLLEAADRALYQAKAAGRNRVRAVVLDSGDALTAGAP